MRNRFTLCIYMGILNFRAIFKGLKLRNRNYKNLVKMMQVKFNLKEEEELHFDSRILEGLMGQEEIRLCMGHFSKMY